MISVPDRREFIPYAKSLACGKFKYIVSGDSDFRFNPNNGQEISHLFKKGVFKAITECSNLNSKDTVIILINVDPPDGSRYGIDFVTSIPFFAVSFGILPLVNEMPLQATFTFNEHKIYSDSEFHIMTAGSPLYLLFEFDYSRLEEMFEAVAYEQMKYSIIRFEQQVSKK